MKRKTKETPPMVTLTKLHDYASFKSRWAETLPHYIESSDISEDDFREILRYLLSEIENL